MTAQYCEDHLIDICLGDLSVWFGTEMHRFVTQYRVVTPPRGSCPCNEGLSSLTPLQHEPWHAMTGIKIFVIVIPKEGLAGTSTANPSFGMTQTIKYTGQKIVGII